MWWRGCLNLCSKKGVCYKYKIINISIKRQRFLCFLIYDKINIIIKKYKGDLTREQFLFKEMRTTAILMIEEEKDELVYEKIVGENLYQYPIEKNLKSIAKACIRRWCNRSNRLTQVLLNLELEGEIRANKEEVALMAFNYFE